MRIYYVITCWLICFTTLDLFGQGRITPNEYINMWKDFAISEMNRSGIPASIKLAQGMLESANGNSRLAVVANNHFGIKCHGWEGEEIYHDDDEKNECFRSYKNAAESFIDHTNFLLTRSRYEFLFEYKSTDYKSWANGLRKAGYATSPRYAQSLIDLIERHSLYHYDMDVKVDRKAAILRPPVVPGPGNIPVVIVDAWDDFVSFNIDRYQVRQINRTDYILAKEGDSYASLSEELDMMFWQLPKYNDAKTTDDLHEGQIVFLQPKRRVAEPGKVTHKVSEGETMHFISQKYAVKLSRLYLLNRMVDGTQPKAGEVLNLRRKKKK